MNHLHSCIRATLFWERLFTGQLVAKPAHPSVALPAPAHPSVALPPPAVPHR